MRVKLAHILLLLTVIFAVLLYRGSLDSIDHLLQDRVMQHERSVDTTIAIIGIDDQSLEDFGSWPWSRNVHAQLLDTLSEGHPAVIGFDLTFPVGSEDPEADTEFAAAVARAENVVLPVYGTFAPNTEQGKIEALELSQPFEALRKAAATTAHINTITDTDRVVRKALYSFDYEGESIHSLSWTVYQKYREAMGAVLIRRNSHWMTLGAFISLIQVARATLRRFLIRRFLAERFHHLILRIELCL